MIAVPEVLADLAFKSAGEAIVLFAFIFAGGKTSESLQALPEFEEGLRRLKAKGAISAEGTSVKIKLEPLQAD